MKTTASEQIVKLAIANVNEAQGYEIELNRADQYGTWFNFTLKSKSGIPGARTSPTGRNLAAASWHAHGYVFDEILNIEPDAIIKGAGGTITKDGGNWVDHNIGSKMFPCMFSETSIL